MDLDLNDIISKLDFPSYYAHLGINTGKSGKPSACACPFCGDSKHFAYKPATGVWICAKCSEKGNAISLTAKLLNKTNGEAVKYIKSYLGIEDPPWEGSGKGVDKVTERTIAPATEPAAAPEAIPLPTSPPEESPETPPASPEAPQ